MPSIFDWVAWLAAIDFSVSWIDLSASTTAATPPMPATRVDNSCTQSKAVCCIELPDPLTVRRPGPLASLGPPRVDAVDAEPSGRDVASTRPAFGVVVRRGRSDRWAGPV